MKSKSLLSLLLLLPFLAQAQNVGIGIPTPQQKLDISGAIRIGTTTATHDGSIRFQSGTFEGYNGGSWRAFTQLPPGTLVASATNPNTVLTNAGFSFFNTVFVNKDTAISTTPDTWLAVQSLNATEGITRHTAIWTGSKMIVWGGIEVENILVNYRRIYDPVTDTWSAISNAPIAERYFHTTIWTGTHMIVWGGRDNNGSFNDGAAYNPATDTWTLLNTVNAPEARHSHTAVWTGTEMLIWGGNATSGMTNTGSKYNFSTNTWTTIPTASAPSERFFHSAIWTGGKMIVWGGFNATFGNDGGIYNNATNTWEGPTSLTNAPDARYEHTTVWTGSEMIVWGGQSPFFEVGESGAKYNPATNSWITVNFSGEPPSARFLHTAIWTGSEMIVFGGRHTSEFKNDGARYDPLANTWTSALSLINAPSGRQGHTAVWTGNQMIIYGGEGNTAKSADHGRYIINSQPNITTVTKSAFYLFSKN